MSLVCEETKAHPYVYTQRHARREQVCYDDTGQVEKTNYFVKNICKVKQIPSSSLNPEIVI